MNAAIDRIEVSRARLRLAMSPPPPTPASQVTGPRSWVQRLTDLPTVAAVFESVGSWWSHHPMRPVAQVVNEASTAVVKPLAQRNPLAMVLAAAAIGAALAWSRPWRWLFRSALFAGLIPQLASRVALSLPIESWMTMVGAAMSRPASASAAARVRGDPA